MINSTVPTTSVLIVEDEAIIAADIEMTLQELGYAITGKAKSGLKALEMLAISTPDIVLLDINLNGSISGVDVAHVIKKDYRIPFVFLTALADPSTLNQAKKTMPYGYIVKPFNDIDLRTTIELALHRYNNQRLDSKPPSIISINKELLSPLSQREYDVMILLDQGFTYKEVGAQLFIGHNTVKTYQKSLFAKLGVGSRHQLSQKLKEIA